MLFSIIVPVYNIEKYVSQCIESILAQTYKDFELILVDDGSTDNSGKICDEYAQKDSRVIVVHKENGGLISARKAGTKIAVGEYIIAVDGDDWISENFLKEAQEIIHNQNIDIICFDHYKAKFKKNIPVDSDFSCGYYDKKALLEKVYSRLLRDEQGKRFPPNIWGKVFKRELYEKYQERMDECIRIGEDECVTFPCVYEAKNIYISHKCLYFYRQNENSMTKTRKKGYPWLDIELRKKWHESLLPMGCHDFQNQLNRLIVHELFSVAKSHLKTNRAYIEVKREIIKEFSRDEYQAAIKNCFYKKNWKEKLALFAVRHKKIFLIYLYAKMERRI